MAREINQIVNVNGMQVQVNGALHDNGAFYGTMYCKFPIRGEDECTHMAHEYYSVTVNRRNRIKYGYEINRPAICGGDMVDTMTFDTYEEMRTRCYMINSVLSRI